MAKIAFFEVKDQEEKLIKKPAEILKADIFPQEVEDIIPQIKDYEIVSPFIYSDLSKKILKQLPNLKMIATRSTGTDHIDFEYCKKSNCSSTVLTVVQRTENMVRMWRLMFKTERENWPHANVTG